MCKKCLKCGADIKTRVWVDGKLRNFQRRKFCTVCSPFGEHNTSKYPTEDDGERICQHHGLTEFVRRPNGSYRCKKCRAADVVKQRQKRKKNLVALLGGKCELCGYDGCIRALEFHHGVPENKSFGLSEACYQYAFDLLEKEVRKCILVCANCHAEIEDGVRSIPVHLVERCAVKS